MSMILGIDLGTTNSSCAFYDGRDVVLVPNDRGMRTTPSVVALSDDGELLVGESARNQSALHPESTISKAKRLMGTASQLNFGKGRIRPEEAASYLLARLKADAEAYLGESVQEAVVTVPAYFSEAQRRSTREAARLAGLEVRRLLNEPTSAAIAWAWTSNRSFGMDEAERHVLVFDLGGGTFDVTVLAMQGEDCRVLAACGDNSLGGSDFDALLLEKVLTSFRVELGEDFARDDPIILQQLIDLVERAKIELSVRESASIVLPFSGRGSAVHTSLKLGRADFEALITPHIDRSLALVAQAVDEAGLDAGMIDRLILSGGSSRIPMVRRKLAALLGKEPEGRVNPEEIVAFGAAVYASLASGKLTGLKIQDALSRSFGVEIDGDEFIGIIPKNSPVPIVSKRTFTTVADNQASVEIHVLQGESPRASENVSLGRFLLSGIRPGKRGEPRIDLEFSVDSDEILHVRARDVDTSASHAVTISASPEGVPKPNSGRLRSLAARASALKDFAAGDLTFQAELEEAVSTAERTVTRLVVAEEAELDEGRALQTELVSEAGAVAMTLETIVAELESRRPVGG